MLTTSAVFLAASFAQAEPVTAIWVLSPAGGETWTAGTTVEIRWGSSNPVGYVDIALEAAGAPYSSIGYAPMIHGRAAWEICEALGDGADYRVRITGQDGEGQPVEALSDPFSITGSVTRPTITLTDPVGGESWTGVPPDPITWTSTNAVGAVHVDLLKAGELERTMAYVPMADGEADWRICSPIADGSDYSVRVSMDGCGPGIEAESGPLTFSGFASVTLLVGQPAGGESWTAGTQQQILWEGLNLFGYAYVDLLKGGQWHAHIAQVRANDGAFVWDICPGIGDGADYSIRAVITDNCGRAVEASSPAFSITGSLPRPTLEVIRPAGGETLTHESTQAIEWQTTGTTADLAIGLIKDGAWYATLGHAPSTDGTFAWAISPHLPYGSDAHVALRLTDCRGVIEDVSEPFTLAVNPADLDLDGDVDQADYALFDACATGPDVPQPDASCTVSDYDGDGDIDNADFGPFQACMSGANVPADPACGE